MQIMYQNDGISKRKLIETITTSTFYLKFKDNNEDDMAAHVFWAVFYSNQRPSQIGPTAENDGASIPPLYFYVPTFYAIVSPEQISAKCKKHFIIELCQYFWQ